MDSKVVKKVVSAVESQLDQEIEKLEHLTTDDLEDLRKKRLDAMKKEAENKKMWLSLGHGEYSEIIEGDIFNVMKKSTNLVVHFYKSDSPRCKIVDHHLKLLAPKHPETRFVKVDAEKAPFLAAKLNVKTLPTLVLVINAKVEDKVIGFSDLGNCDDFSTEMLEWRIAHSKVINYDDDLFNPPEKTKINQKKPTHRRVKGIIRGKDSDGSDSD